MRKQFFLWLSALLLLNFGVAFAQSPSETPAASPTPAPMLVTVHLLADRDSLVLATPSDQRVNLKGFEFQALLQGTIRSVALSNGFSVLQLTSGLVEAGSCFIYELSGTSPPLPSACAESGLVFRRDVARADVFWYDSVANQPLDIAVYQNGILATTCSAANPNCPIPWEIILPTATPQPTVTFTPTSTNTAEANDNRPHLSVSAACAGDTANFYLSNNGASMRHSIQWTVYVNGVNFLGGSTPPMIGGLKNSFFYHLDSVDGAEVRLELVDNGEAVLDTGTTTITCPPVGGAVVSTVPSVTNGYPCTGTIIPSDASELNVVRAWSSNTAPLATPVQPNISVIVTEKSNQDWYRINYGNPPSTGWILARYIVLSIYCPQ